MPWNITLDAGVNISGVGAGIEIPNALTLTVHDHIYIVKGHIYGAENLWVLT